MELSGMAWIVRVTALRQFTIDEVSIHTGRAI